MVCLDIETTGLDKSKDWIVQLSMIKFDKNTLTLIDTFDEYIRPSQPYVMSIAALAKHRITPAFLRDKPTFIDFKDKILDFLKDEELLGYNIINFDAPFLKQEFKRCGIDWNFSNYKIYDSFAEEKRRNGNTLEETFKRYTNKTMEEYGLAAHNSLSDVKATIKVFGEQSKISELKPEEILTEDNFIKIMYFAGKDAECFTHGKYSHVSVEWVAKYDSKYLIWILENDFDIKTKEICRKYLNL